MSTIPQMVRVLRTSTQEDPLAENNSLGSHVYSPKGRVPNPDAVQEDLASSVALARFMFQASFTTRTDAHREWFKTKLNNAMTRVCEASVLSHWLLRWMKAECHGLFTQLGWFQALLLG